MELTRLAEQRPQELYEAAERLCRGASGGRFGGTSAARAVGRIAETLADTCSRDCAVYAVDVVGRLLPLGTEAREEGDRLRRSVAARLVKAQRLRDLEPLFGELPDDLHDPAAETRACLLGELALIGSGTGRRCLDAYAERLRELGHPLARLPRTRLDVEHRFVVRVRGLGPVRTPQQLRSRLPEVPPTGSGAVAGRGAVGPDEPMGEAALDPCTLEPLEPVARRSLLSRWAAPVCPTTPLPLTRLTPSPRSRMNARRVGAESSKTANPGE
ncbi:DUF6183 family protein [Streptomyces sp. NPDC058625]|uniref:DUF6183 family protein n=1 Tax=Streptomyces sp. NPDC058625 TaxID=3346564 RepID=UPI003667314A